MNWTVTRAYEWASNTRGDYGIATGFLDRAVLYKMIEDLEIRVQLFDFEGEFIEMVRRGWIGIERSLTRPERKWVAAHGLGHHLMHVGNQTIRSGFHQWLTEKQEREAEEFAGWLLWGIPDLNIKWSAEALAHEAGVPVGFVDRWKQIAGASRGLSFFAR